MQLANLITTLLYFYAVLIQVWVVLTWIPRRPGGLIDDISAALGRLVVPFLNLFRRFIPSIGGIDVSPIFALLVLLAIQRLMVRVLI